jgi:hypothetical protein
MPVHQNPRQLSARRELNQREIDHVKTARKVDEPERRIGQAL